MASEVDIKFEAVRENDVATEDGFPYGGFGIRIAETELDGVGERDEGEDADS